MPACPACGVELAGRPKFCPECGTRLDPATAVEGESRRVVTILFSDLTGSTALGERLDPEAVRTLMGRYFGAMKAVLERHGGTVEKFIGDAVMAVFGLPTLHEDDALRAVRAAAQMREALAALNVELEAERGLTILTRTGITTGEVVTGDPSAGQTLVTGDTVNTAARLEQAAAPGEILIGAPTWKLVRDAVTADAVEAVSAKGKALPVPAYRLVSVTAGAEGHSRRMDAPLVGRERELARLTQSYRDAVEQRSPQLFTLLGAAGVGKSRLVREFLASVEGDSRILRGRCLPYGEGITYWPLAEALKDAAAISESDDRSAAQRRLLALLDGERDAELLAGRLATAIGLSDDPAPQTELFWAVRRTFEHLAQQQPMVVVWEDIHWAEPTFLDLIDHLADWTRDAPIVLLAPARPELLDARQGWGGGKLNASTLLLEALPAEAAGRLIDALPGGTALPPSLRERIATAAEGNPLFVEEMLAMLVDDGTLRSVDGGWQAGGELEHLAIPATIQALLAARLDRLSVGERQVAARASVVGRIFEPEAVAALSSETEGLPLNERLMALVRKELVRPDRSEVTGGDAFKFRHILIRDAAYGALPKRERADLHERFADWLEHAAGDRIAEFGEIIGHHLEQAVRYRTELGVPPSLSLNVRAGALLRGAAGRAATRGDSAGAMDMYGRALALDPLPASASRDILPEFIDAVIDASDFAAARRWIAAGHEAAEQSEDRRLGAWCSLLASRVDSFDRNQPSAELGKVELAALQAIFAACGDHLGIARIEADRGGALWGLGRVSLAAEAYERAAIHAAADDPQMAERHRVTRLQLLAGGAAPVSEVLSLLRSEDAVRTGSARGFLGLTEAWCEAASGNIDQARERAADARVLLADHGYKLMAEIAAQEAALIECTGGRTDVAIEILTTSCDALHSMGERAYFSTSVGLLANLLCDVDEYEAALDRASQSEASSDPSDVLTEALWRMARGRCLAALDAATTEEASTLVAEAIDIVERTEWVQFRAILREAAARFAESIRDEGAAIQHLERAHDLYVRKEARLDAARVEQRLTKLR